jgi:hypothetical protein
MPPAANSHPSFIRPVSGSIAEARTMSLTVNLIAFSGATPCKGGIQVKESKDRRNAYDELRSQSAIES